MKEAENKYQINFEIVFDKTSSQTFTLFAFPDCAKTNSSDLESFLRMFIN